MSLWVLHNYRAFILVVMECSFDYCIDVTVTVWTYQRGHFINHSAMCLKWLCDQFSREKVFNVLSDSDNWHVTALTSKVVWEMFFSLWHENSNILELILCLVLYHIISTCGILFRYCMCVVFEQAQHSKIIQATFKQCICNTTGFAHNILYNILNVSKNEVVENFPFWMRNEVHQLAKYSADPRGGNGKAVKRLAIYFLNQETHTFIPQWVFITLVL